MLHQLQWYVLSVSILGIIAGILETARAEGGIHSGSGTFGKYLKKGKFFDHSREEPKRHRLNPNYDPSEHKRTGNLKMEAGGALLGEQPATTTTLRTTTTTEPDWDYICYVLCGEGDGGLVSG